MYTLVLYSNIEFNIPPSHKSHIKVCALFIFARQIKIWTFLFMVGYLNLLLLYIKLFITYTTIKTLTIMWVSLSINNTLTTLPLILLLYQSILIHVSYHIPIFLWDEWSRIELKEEKVDLGGG